MDWQERIIVDPDILVGKPVVKGTRLAVEFIVDLLAQGWSAEEIRRNYPGLTPADIQACLGYASAILKAEMNVLDDIKVSEFDRLVDQFIEREDPNAVSLQALDEAARQQLAEK